MATIPEHDLQEIENARGLLDSGSVPRTSREQNVARVWLLWDHRRSLFRLTIWGTLVVALISFLIPNRYISTTRLMPPDDASGTSVALMESMIGRVGGGLGALAGDALGLKSSGALFMGILKSRTVEDDIIQKFNLRKVYSQRLWEGARRVLESNTIVAEDRKNGIVLIQIIDTDPKRAAAIADEYIAQLNFVVSQLSTSSARRERIFLEQRLAEVRQNLEISEKNFSEFSSKNGAIDIKEQGRAMLDAASTLQGQLIAVQSEIEAAKQIYADNNVRVRSLKARAAELQTQLQKLGGKADINDSTAASDNYPSLRKLPLLGVTYADLYRESKVEEAIYETLTQEYELAKVAEAKEIPTVKVLDPPDVPEKKSSPPRLVIVLMGSVLCFLSCTFWLLLKAWWDESDPQSLHKAFANEVSVTISRHALWGRGEKPRSHRLLRRIWNRSSR